MKLLLVEDNERVAQFVKKGLTESGHTVDHAATGREGIFLAASEPYDAIIMDRMLPGGIDGLGIIEALRKTGNLTPILILSALGEVDERIRGLKAGGDDYLVKPFEFGELLARVDALLRRSQTRHVETVLIAGDLQMDLLTHKVTCGESVVALQPREFKLLEYLMRHADQVVTRTMLLENVWDYHFQPQTNVIDVHISKLRQKIDVGTDRQRLRTMRNAGYMLTSNALALCLLITEHSALVRRCEHRFACRVRDAALVCLEQHHRKRKGRDTSSRCKSHDESVYP
ncbi:MAG: DNA-binding response regulator [Herminiimonas sp.]|nr:DNA-binding response regulator [Herminiimonas sp.]